MRLLFLFFTFAGAFSTQVSAQDTRGGTVPDALVLLADGTTVKAEDLKQGNLVWVWDGKPAAAKISAVRRTHVDSFILLKAGDAEVRANGSHRVWVNGRLARLDTVKAGDRVQVLGAKGPVETPVASVRLYLANLVAYDFTVEGHLPFALNGVLVGD